MAGGIAAAAAMLAAAAAARVAGDAKVRRDMPPSMGSEDFSYMLKARPGSYIWMGNARTDGGCFLHNPNYDFNDEALGLRASYWVRPGVSVQAKASS